MTLSCMCAWSAITPPTSPSGGISKCHARVAPTAISDARRFVEAAHNPIEAARRRCHAKPQRKSAKCQQRKSNVGGQSSSGRPCPRFLVPVGASLDGNQTGQGPARSTVFSNLILGQSGVQTQMKLIKHQTLGIQHSKFRMCNVECIMGMLFHGWVRLRANIFMSGGQPSVELLLFESIFFSLSSNMTGRLILLTATTTAIPTTNARIISKIISTVFTHPGGISR